VLPVRGDVNAVGQACVVRAARAYRDAPAPLLRREALRPW